MSRTSRHSLGSVETPYGTVTVRIERSPRSESRYLACQGATLALRWMFPAKPIDSDQTRIRVAPSRPHTTDGAISTLYAELVAGWDHRRNEGDQRLANAPRGTDGLTLNQLVEELDQEARVSVRASTLSAYRFEWKAVTQLIPGSSFVARIDRATVIAALAQDLSGGAAPETRRKHFVALKRLLDRALSKGSIQRHPMEGLKLPKVPRRVAVFLTREQREEVLRVAAKRGRDYHLLFGCGVFLGLRKAELMAMRWEQFDFSQRIAQVLNTDDFLTKSGRNRTIPMCADLVDLLRPYRQEKGFVLKPEKLFGSNARYRWECKEGFKTVVTEAGLDPRVFTTHTLRHTFASIVAQAGVSLYKIGQWMGHSTSEVTELYAHLAAFDDDIERLGGQAQSSRAAG